MDKNIITFLACICLLFIFGRIFIVPIKKILKLVINSLLGAIVIYVINFIGGTFGFHIGLNIFTSLIIRIIRLARCYLFNCYKIINYINTYSTVTDFARFLGLSTSSPFSFEI